MIEGDAVVYEVIYPHSAQRVWNALHDPERLAAWLMPTVGYEPVGGRRFTMACDPFGEIEAEVIEADPPRRLSWRWIGSFGDTVVTFELTAADHGTRCPRRAPRLARRQRWLPGAIRLGLRQQASTGACLSARHAGRGAQLGWGSPACCALHRVEQLWRGLVKKIHHVVDIEATPDSV